MDPYPIMRSQQCKHIELAGAEAPPGYRDAGVSRESSYYAARCREWWEVEKKTSAVIFALGHIPIESRQLSSHEVVTPTQNRSAAVAREDGRILEAFHHINSHAEFREGLWRAAFAGLVGLSRTSRNPAKGMGRIRTATRARAGGCTMLSTPLTCLTRRRLVAASKRNAQPRAASDGWTGWRGRSCERQPGAHRSLAAASVPGFKCS